MLFNDTHGLNNGHMDVMKHPSPSNPHNMEVSVAIVDSNFTIHTEACVGMCSPYHQPDFHFICELGAGGMFHDTICPLLRLWRN